MGLQFDPNVFDPIGGPDSKWKKRAGGPNTAEHFDDFTDGWGFEANDADNSGKFSETANLGEYLVTVIDGDTDSGEVIACADDAPGGQIYAAY